ncbi:MAG: SIS domain-containing protein [bacterium]|nr:SIS domain-containing protein [bacterium]
MTHQLNDIQKIKTLDSKNMLGSLELLGAQISEVGVVFQGLKLPESYKNCKNIVVAGMGGSALGAHIIKTLFAKNLAVPVEIINHYELPAYVSEESLVVVSSYSGTTEEAVSAFKSATNKNASVVVICAGGELAKLAEEKKVPALVFTTKNNPCGSPRMGLGYSIFGQLYIFARLGFVNFSENDFAEAIGVVEKYNIQFGVNSLLEDNTAKKFAEKINDKSVWFSGSEHLVGNAHVSANQMNENAKRFAGYFVVPEFNHHLMEGMMKPENNPDNLVFITLESNLYHPKVQRRYEVTKTVLEKNNISYLSYQCQENETWSQMIEVLVFGSYLSFYTAISHDIDPTAIPFVDFFKQALNTK